MNVIAAAIAIGISLLTFAGLLSSPDSLLGIITNVLLQFALIVVSIALIMGVINLVTVHAQRAVKRERGWYYSTALLGSAAAVIALYALGDRAAGALIVETVVVPVESALTILVFVALVLGAYRLLQRRLTWSAVLFIVTLLVILAGTVPIAEAGAFRVFRDWLYAVPVSAGTRGILLGIALATIVTAIRVFIGQDRSYRE